MTDGEAGGEEEGEQVEVSFWCLLDHDGVDVVFSRCIICHFFQVSFDFLAGDQLCQWVVIY